MIDSGDGDGWRPSTFIRNTLGRTVLDYLFITNADQDHMSDLQGLWDAKIDVRVLYRNQSYTSADYTLIKSLSGPLTDDAKRYAWACNNFNQPVKFPFNDNMGGITATVYCNSFPQFIETNDLSLVVFLNYAGFQIIFPGDLEKAGWRALLQRYDFQRELARTTIFVASHHGRENGFCEEVFNYCKPQAVVISDKPIAHETQQTVPDYRAIVDGGVMVRTTMKTRHVLTTRRDGTILFRVNCSGGFVIDTECAG
jgi:beta-lactamase superfamily II metal-dependent hydrolase